MDVSVFLKAHSLCPSQIPGEACTRQLLADMEKGLRGVGSIPMLPTYLPPSVAPPANAACCVLDAGGTNLRTAVARFDADGNCHLTQLRRCSMPGTLSPMGMEEFYEAVAGEVRASGNWERVGFCFSYDVLSDRALDGTLLYWCKEVQIPEAVGKPVGSSLKAALGASCKTVHVLNDSAAAMLGASGKGRPVQIGIIMGTGINVCYSEKCSTIGKVPKDLHSDSMIISTEAGEFDGIPKSEFDLSLFAATDDPVRAHAEKQCAGGYLGALICRVWRAAAAEGLLPDTFLSSDYSLSQISDALAAMESSVPHDPTALEIAGTLIHRAAKIAAILCAGPVLRSTAPHTSVNIAVEGSQFYKLTGFRRYFCLELDLLLAPHGITYSIVQEENACLIGAALAAFAQPM